MQFLKYITDPYKKFETSSLFLKIFQLVLFIWIFSIPLKNAVYQISTFLIVILFFIHYFYYKQKAFLLDILITYKKLLIVFLLFITSMTLSTLLGISKEGELFSIFKYFYRYILIFIILLYFYKQSFFSRQWLLSTIFVVLCLNSLDGIYQYIVGIDFLVNRPPDGPSYLLTGAVHQHNPFGLFMAIGASMSLVLFSDKHNYTIFKYDKIIYFISLLMFFFTLFHSQSRSAWVMFGIFSLGYLVLYMKNNGIDKKLFYTISSLLVISTIFFLIDDNLSQRLTLLLQGNSAGRTSQIWPFTIDKIMDSPIFGYGINTYKLLMVGTPAAYHAGVHNISLELLLYTGIVGFVIFSYIIWLTLKESFTKNNIVYFILFLSYIMLLQFDGSLIAGKLHSNVFILIVFFIYSFRLNNTSSVHDTN
jgi:O-antigen ligase